MTLQEAYASQKNNNNKREMIVRVPELVHLVRHLDLLYSELIIKKPEHSQEQPMVEIIGKPYIQTAGWYNAGQGIKQSAVVQ